MAIVYPVARLLAQPKIFHALANFFNGRPDADTIRTCFYDLLEIDFEERDEEDCEFDAQEAVFDSQDDGTIFTIQLDNGVLCELKATEGEVKAQIRNDRELATSSAIYQRLVTAIEESCPEFLGDIALSSPPTPGNNYLSSDDGEGFSGSFHLKSNPDKEFAFDIQVVDPDQDHLTASIKPL